MVFRTRRKVARAELQTFLSEISKRILRGRSFACLITGDEELRVLNRHYRRKDYATDVLSFCSDDAGPFAGDLAISADRARAQASEHGHSIDDELRILILHGALHLAGMDHETDSGEMARVEMRWRKRLALPNGLIERT
jgi:probable rRNA maturation factor